MLTVGCFHFGRGLSTVDKVEVYSKRSIESRDSEGRKIEIPGEVLKSRDPTTEVQSTVELPREKCKWRF